MRRDCTESGIAGCGGSGHGLVPSRVRVVNCSRPLDIVESCLRGSDYDGIRSAVRLLRSTKPAAVMRVANVKNV